MFSWALAVLLYSSVSLSAPQEPTEEAKTVHSVCDVLNKRLELDKKVIRLRGMVGGTEEAVFMYDPKCKQYIHVQGVDFPGSIVVEPIPEEGYKYLNVFLKPDKQALDAFEKALRQKSKADDGTRDLWIIYEGVYETRTALHPYEYHKGILRADGFGPMGAFLSRFMILKPIAFELTGRPKR